MPITPHFEVSQTDSHVHVEIQVPHVRVSAESLQVVLTDEDQCLHFASPPYLLILTFPNAFQENAEDACAQYDPLKGRVVLQLAKETPGIYWEDLDLVGALMKPRNNLNNFIRDATDAQSPQKSTWIQEVLNEEITAETSGQDAGPPENATETISSNNNTHTGYGFGRMFHGIFTDLARDGLAKEMLEIPTDIIGDNPLSITDESKPDLHNQRKEMELSKFCKERYLQDLDVQDDYLYQCAMAMRPHWRQPQTENGTKYFTPEESAILASIPYPLLPSFTPQDSKRLWLGVLDLLFAYCYDHLLTDGDPTVESAWTVSILSCSLSWLESYDNDTTAEDVVVASLRRSLIYPYLRSLEYATFVWKQVSQYILRQGRRCIIRSLLQLRQVLQDSELYYLGNKLYIDPYLAWLQQKRDDDAYLVTLADQIDNALGMDSERLEERLDLGLEKIALQNDDATSTEGSDSEESSSEDSEDSDDNSSVQDEDATSHSDDKAAGRTSCQKEPINSKELLDGNFTQQQPATPSLILDMSKLSIEPKETGTSSCQSEKPVMKKLIQEVE